MNLKRYLVEIFCLEPFSPLNKKNTMYNIKSMARKREEHLCLGQAGSTYISYNC